MTMIKKFFLPLLALIALAGCASHSTTLNISPQMVLPPQDPTLQGITISINGADMRQNKALARVNRDGQLLTLSAQRDPRFLLQEILEKQMIARGYMVGANGAVDLQIVINRLYADVSEGNLRYNITGYADVSVIASAHNGSKLTKTYHASYNEQGAFNASNSKIANALNNALSDVISSMAQDTGISDFIKTNAR